MATHTDTQVVELFINGAQSANELSKLSEKAEELRKKMKQLEETGDMKGLRTSTKELGKVEKQIEQMHNKMDVFRKTMDNLSSAKPQELRETIRQLNRELNNGSVQRGSQEWKEYTEMLKSAKSELEKVRKEQSAGESGLDKFNGKIKKFGAAAASVIATVTLVKGAVDKLQQMYIKEEDARANLQALTGLDDKSVTWLNDQARKLSSTMDATGLRVRESSDQIMEAYMLVGSARPELLGNKEALNAVTVEAMRLAQAAKMDLGEAVQGVTAGLAQFSLGADESQRVVNALAAGSQKGAANVQDQTATLIRAGLVAKNAGLSFEELIGVTETLADRQIKGEVAGTALRKIFLSLQTGATEFNPSIVGLTAALDNLNKANLSASEIKKMFGEEGYTAASVLIQNTESVKQFTTAVTGTSVAFDQAAINSDTTSARMAQLSNAVQIAGSALYEKLNPALMTVVSWQTKWVSVIPPLIRFLSEYSGFIWILTGYLLLNNTAMWTSIGLKIKSTAATIKETFTTKANTVSLVANAIAVHGLAAAKALLTGNIGAAKAAWSAMTAVMSVNHFFAIAAAIFTIGYAIVKMVTYKSAATKAEEEYTQELIKQQQEVGSLVDLYKESADGTLDKAKALDELKKRYGPYLQDLIDEKGQITDIEAAHRRINGLLGQQIALKMRDEKTVKIYEKYTPKIGVATQTLRESLLIQKNDPKLVDSLLSELNSKLQSSNNLDKTKAEFKATLKANKIDNTDLTFVGHQSINKNTDDLIEVIIDRKKETTKNTNFYASQVGGKLQGTNADTEINKGLKAIDDTHAAERAKIEDQNKKKLIDKQAYEKAIKDLDIKVTKEKMARLEQIGQKETSQYTELQTKLAELVPTKVAVVPTQTSEDKVKAAYDKQANALKYNNEKAINEIKIDPRTSPEEKNLELTENQRKHNEDRLALMRAFNKKETSEYEQLLAEKISLQETFQDKAKAIDETASIERKEVLIAFLESSIDESTYHERNYQIQKDALAKKLALSKENNNATKQEQLALQIELLELNKEYMERSDKGKKTWEDRKKELTQKYLKTNIEEMYNEEISNLDEVFAKKLISEEQYKQMQAAIRLKYNRQGQEAGLSEYQPKDVKSIWGPLFREERNLRRHRLDELELEKTAECLTAEQVAERKKAINADFYKEVEEKAQKAYAQVNSVIQTSADLVNNLQEHEISKVELKYARQIKAAGSNTKEVERLEKEKEKEIAKVKSDFADKAFAMQVAQAVAQTAMAAISAYSSTVGIPLVGPALAPVAAGMAVAAGMVQIATINNQREMAKQQGYRQGGYTARIDKDEVAGVVHGGEFVSTYEAVRNNSVRPVLDLIDQAQRNNTVANLSRLDMARTLGYGITPVQTVNTPPVQVVSTTSPELTDAIKKLSKMIEKPITAQVSLLGKGGINETQKLYSRIQSNK